MFFQKMLGRGSGRSTVTDENVKLDAFRQHWQQVKLVLENSGPWSVKNRTRGKNSTL
jgi:hypothetical protein